jgi:glycosyltransferase involved in cell wall biosynthesis
MAKRSGKLISVVVPAYNEAEGLPTFHTSLVTVLDLLNTEYEIIYCDDGSNDSTYKVLKTLEVKNGTLRIVKLSRNFGKEAALSAGITEARGDAIIMLDADGQHPVELIPDFIQAWHDGAQVVVGLRTNPSGKGLFKDRGPKLFFKFFNKITGLAIEPGSSDYRLIDATVQRAFVDLHENGRVTRILIDWLGFERTFIHYTARDREIGQATYSNRQLIKLAADTFISSSPRPLFLFGYIGVLISFCSLMLGVSIIIEQLLLNDPLNWGFTGTAMLGVLIIFLVGMVLMSQGILSLYISHIHTQSKQRPLYVIDRSRSVDAGSSYEHQA